MFRSVSTAALLLAAVHTSSAAGERKLFENVKGWEVEQNVDSPGPQSCQIAYSYKDKDDKNAENVVVVALDGQNLNLVLGYENWEWDADEKVTAPIRADKQVLFAKQGWSGSGKILKTQLPASVIPKLVRAKQIVLEMGDGTADFNIPNFTDAVDSMKRCNATFDPANASAQTAAAPPAPAPSEDRQFAYGAGLALQQMVAKCEINTTASQRATLDSKLAALRPEMASFDAQVRADLNKPDGVTCPTHAAGVETIAFGIKSFVELSPEAFTAAFKGRIAENEARAKAEADAKAKAETETKMRAEIEARMRAEADAKSRAEADARERAQMEARIRSEVEAKLRAEAEAKTRADAAKAESPAKADAANGASGEASAKP